MFLGPFHRGLLTSSQGGLPVPGGGLPVPGCRVPVPGGGVAVGGRRPAIQPDLVQQDPDVVLLLGTGPALVCRLLPRRHRLAPPPGQLTGIALGRSYGITGNLRGRAFPGGMISVAGRTDLDPHRLIPPHRGLIPGARGNVASGGFLTAGLRGTVPGTGHLITIVGLAVTLIRTQPPVSPRRHVRAPFSEPAATTSCPTPDQCDVGQLPPRRSPVSHPLQIRNYARCIHTRTLQPRRMPSEEANRWPYGTCTG